jgi:hypothetical protein
MGGPPVIDVDRIEAQLAAIAGAADPVPVTVRTPPVPAPTPAPAPKPAPRRAATPRAAAPKAAEPKRRRHVAGPPPMATVRQLLELGRIEEVDARIAARSVTRDTLTWTTMRALLEGRSDSVATGIRELSELGRSGDAEALARSWIQRFWAAFEWGTDGERYDVLDHCRTRAYRFDDLEWWGNLTLLLAAWGKTDEATRAFDQALPLLGGTATDPVAIDVVTNLIEAAGGMNDADRAAAAGRLLRVPAGRLVVVGEAVVCKGSVDRYSALVHAAQARWGEAAACFRSAEEAHRALGAGPLLARTLHQASGSPVAA